MAFLAIRSVKYNGKKYSYQSPSLSNGLNVLAGENGTGKSTFANLIYYGLGGGVDSFVAEKSDRHAEITGDSDNYVELLVSINNDTYTVRRVIGMNDVAVLGADISTVLPLNRKESSQFTFSDWILGKLGIEPVSIAYGLYSGKLNITDLMRLMYHDQSPDPSGVFKAVDKESFVADSRVFRAAIFEILLGKSYQEYYSALSAHRNADRDRAAAARVMEQFAEMMSELRRGEEEMNTVFIDKNLSELREQQSKLLGFRRELVKAPPAKTPGVDLPALQRDLLAAEVKLSEFARREAGLLEESSRLEQLKSELVAEATQLRKIMFANEELQLFSENTCPYCLKDVERVPHRCVCGSEVIEGDYEKFFYDSAEYLAILKSRQKNVETVHTASQSVLRELNEVRAEKVSTSREAERIESLIHDAVKDSDARIDLQQFELTEDRLSLVRQDIDRLEQQRELVSRGESLQKQVDSATIAFESSRSRVQALAAAAQADIQAKRIKFSEVYNEMMRKTLKDCQSASIDENYMPVINGGQYTEASAAVPRRLLYFATLLQMSLTDDTVSYPRFLLIDTPETSGIDAENLNAAISRVVEVIAKGKEQGRECQVILTTGLGKYPVESNPNLLGTMRKNGQRLLKLKPSNA